MTRAIVVALIAAVAAAAVTALACHALGLDAHVFAIIPLAVAAMVGRYVFGNTIR